ncbi:uncharacterized protein [Elaeis guineensis]|uniref:uncharacterized protein n=1 Tax=Elaeis guineensis var. tenera TaxID=51953 RepID=UPI003C6DACA1
MESTILKAQIQNVEKLETFNGLNYKCWSIKVLYQLTTAKVAYNALQKRYVNEDAGNKSFLVNKNINFKMDDSKPIIVQVNELNEIASYCTDAGEMILEIFQVSTIIGKLPPSWRDYQKILKHKNKSLSLNQLLQHIQLENEARIRDEVDNQNRDRMIRNVEGLVYSNFKFMNKFPSRKKGSSNNRKRGKSEENGNKKRKGPCFVCGKFGHLARVCHYCKGQNKNDANVIEDSEMVAMITYILMVNIEEGWSDFGATCHATPYRNLFKSYEAFSGEKSVFIGNSSSCAITGKGTISFSYF